MSYYVSHSHDITMMHQYKANGLADSLRRKDSITTQLLSGFCLVVMLNNNRLRKQKSSLSSNEHTINGPPIHQREQHVCCIPVNGSRGFSRGFPSQVRHRRGFVARRRKKSKSNRRHHGGGLYLSVPFSCFEAAITFLEALSS
jgi:hypothetical protein